MKHVPKGFYRLQLHGTIYRPDSFVLMLRYCANLKLIRYESTSLNRIVADKSHRLTVAIETGILQSYDEQSIGQGVDQKSIKIYVKHLLNKLEPSSSHGGQERKISMNSSSNSQILNFTVVFHEALVWRLES